MFNSQNTTLRLWVNRFIIPAVFVFIWSAGFVVARYAMPHSPPMSFLVVRFFCSLIAFAIWAYFSGVQWPQSKSQTMHLLVVGALMQVGYRWCLVCRQTRYGGWFIGTYYWFTANSDRYMV